ncbi:ABC transporter substrate-binding protein [Desertifilum sp. FACHB-1129]|nr:MULTISPECIES: ABC transporter substrate-binding protein [Desertifilum]MBD2313377.1 ABC transporter substrate-binding protein [Desertifilum sp. FACHB-1129]MBD2324448.1 ABC transporter substrate-binding protein [Desertifilum sp. FACHB-866]MBD2334462.1 ABC transporter substrate-binding protein [Desertifilum sp. FACHB-868]OEJ75894.1 ABC transporter substrate-binding protein [Desertifilum tharense IPPAS B-1220]
MRGERTGWKRGFTACFLMISVTFMSSCASTSASNTTGGRQVIRIAIGTQDQVINTAVGGAVVREMELLQKHLPRTGKYENVEYKIEWSSYTSGPPITNKMVAGQIDIGLMGDFPAVINMLTFQKEVANADSLFIGTLAYSPTGAGNAVVVPKDSPVTSLADLRGKTVSVPFGSAAHGMLLKALETANLNPEQDVKLISQSPEVGGSSLRTGQIDAHADFVPFGELFPFRGFARKIFDGAQTGKPTLHGIVVRSDFAEQYPEVVVAYLKAILEANQMFREEPEAIAANIQEWSGVEKEVVYMFLGPSGLQALSPAIEDVHLTALKNSVATLAELGRVDAGINPDSIVDWVDDRFLRQAIEEMNLDYDRLVAEAGNYVITGNDALTNEPITNPKMAAQLWVQGEETVMSFASIANMLQMLPKLQEEGKAANVLFVHDRENGWKLFAENSYFVQTGNEISAFLSAEAAQNAASASGGRVAAFKDLQQFYAQQSQQALLVAPR